MAHIQIVTGGGATFKDLIDFVEKCKEKKIPNNVPVKISQHEDNITDCDIIDMQGDEDSIIFYDYI